MNYKNSVLFVDDQNDLLLLIDRMLTNEEYNKFYANSALEALELMENTQIDVIVTDMIMPDISGLKLLELLKDKHPDVVKIVLSGHAQVPSILEAINKGDIFRYITKPWRITEDGKQIIRDAVEYARLIKLRISNTPIMNNLSSKELSLLLDKLGLEYIILENDSLLHHSDSLSKIAAPHSTPLLLSKALLGKNFEHIRINKNISGYFKQK